MDCLLITKYVILSTEERGPPDAGGHCGYCTQAGERQREKEAAWVQEGL